MACLPAFAFLPREGDARRRLSLSLSAFHGARAAGWLPCSALLAVPPQPLGRRRRLARLTVWCVGGGARRCECAVTAVTREAARRFSCLGAWMLDEAAVDGWVLALCVRERGEGCNCRL